MKTKGREKETVENIKEKRYLYSLKMKFGTYMVSE